VAHASSAATPALAKCLNLRSVLAIEIVVLRRRSPSNPWHFHFDCGWNSFERFYFFPFFTHTFLAQMAVIPVEGERSHRHVVSGAALA